MKQETADEMIKSLGDDVLDELLADHWREIKGILKEQKRRRKLNVPKPQ